MRYALRAHMRTRIWLCDHHVVHTYTCTYTCIQAACAYALALHAYVYIAHAKGLGRVWGQLDCNDSAGDLSGRVCHVCNYAAYVYNIRT